jgi:2-dehydro-3-deoxyglucarate aldolase
MNRTKKIKKIRLLLKSGKTALGSWMQIPSSSVAEIMGQSGYQWVAIDMEHGAINNSQLPDIFRALELGDTLPLVRVAQGSSKDCKQALDAGAGGIIVPMVESAEQLEIVKNFCKWPPSGTRGVGFSRANLFGKFFDNYTIEAQNPLLIAMIENIESVNNLESILQVSGLDAIFIGPYDLSASLGITGQFNNSQYTKTLDKILLLATKYSIPFGIHIVNPNADELNNKIKEKYQFIAYSIDSVFLSTECQNPII